MDLAGRVEGKLRGVIDPETRENVVEMGLIRDLAVTGEGRVSLRFRPTSFHCPLAFVLALDIYRAVEGIGEVTEVELQVVDCIYADEINGLLESGEV